MFSVVIDEGDSGRGRENNDLVLVGKNREEINNKLDEGRVVFNGYQGGEDCPRASIFMVYWRMVWVSFGEPT